MRIYHESAPNFPVTCNTDKCKDTFTTVKCYVRHVSNKHKHALVNELPVSSEEGDVTVSVTNDGISVDDDDDDDGDNSVQTTVSVEQSVHQFGQHAACCILKFREKHVLPASVVQGVVDEMNFMVSHVHETNKSVFRTVLEEHGVAPVNEGLSSFLLCDSSLYSGVFAGIDTDYKLKNTICNTFLLAKPT